MLLRYIYQYQSRYNSLADVSFGKYKDEIFDKDIYIIGNYYNKFEEVKKENNLLDYTDLEIYTLRLLYNEKKDYSIEEETENSIIKAKERKANIINEIFEKIKNNKICDDRNDRAAIEKIIIIL